MRTRATLLAVLMLAILATVFAAGCQRGGGGGGEGEGPRVGLSISTLNNPFFVSMRSGAQQAAKDEGVQLLIADALPSRSMPSWSTPSTQRR
jgi:ribose transport system substrate-binding protein